MPAGVFFLHRAAAPFPIGGFEGRENAGRFPRRQAAYSAFRMLRPERGSHQWSIPYPDDGHAAGMPGSVPRWVLPWEKASFTGCTALFMRGVKGILPHHLLLSNCGEGKIKNPDVGERCRTLKREFPAARKVGRLLGLASVFSLATMSRPKRQAQVSDELRISGRGSVEMGILPLTKKGSGSTIQN